MPILLVLGFAAVAPSSAPAAAQIAAEVTIARVAADRWQVDYVFAEPITALELGRAVASYRADAWTVTTPGVELVERDGAEMLVADSARTRIRLLVGRYDDFVSGAYVPMIAFSDGGMALYVGSFTGRARVGEDTHMLDARFRFVPQAGENVEAPSAGATDAYAYFGPQRPIASDHARLILDPALPAWMREELLATAHATIDVLAGGLGQPLPAPPLMMIGADRFDTYEGGSLKGGAIADQFVVLLRGSGFVDPDPDTRAIVQRLFAHEIVHLFQLATIPSGAYSETEPWLHEGSAEAMAIHALGASGIWGPARVDRYAAEAEAACDAAIGDLALADAVRAGQAQAIYPCGLGLYWKRAGDPVTLWSRLAARVRAGEPYTTATLDEVVRQAGR